MPNELTLNRKEVECLKVNIEDKYWSSWIYLVNCPSVCRDSSFIVNLRSQFYLLKKTIPFSFISYISDLFHCWGMEKWKPSICINLFSWRGFDPWIGKIPWRRKWQPTPVLSPGESHGQRSLVGYSPRGRKSTGSQTVGQDWAISLSLSLSALTHRSTPRF